MWIFPLIFLIVFLFFLRGIFNSGSAGLDQQKHRSETAREILDKRFAKGEISEQEYEKMKKALSGDDQ